MLTIPKVVARECLLRVGVVLLIIAGSTACSDEDQSAGSSSPEPAASTAATEDPPFKAEIKVDAEPGYITIGGGSVWVGNHIGGTVSRIDPNTNQVTKVIAVNGEPTGMLFAFEDVWTFAALKGQLNRIDADKNKVVARVPLKGTGGGINGLAAGVGYIWVAENSGSVYGVDPESNKVVKTIKVLEGCGPGGNITFAEGAIWYACWDEPFLWRLDPTSGEVTEKIRVGAMAGSPADGGNLVWVPVMSEGVVVGVDPMTNEPSARVRVGSRVEQVRVRGGDMWARVSDTELAHVSLKRKEVTEMYELPSAPIPGGGLAIGFGSVWVANFGEGTVWRV